MKKLFNLLIFSSLIILAACKQTPSKPKTFSNPVFEPVLADPAIIRHDGVYYVYGTQDYGQWGDEFGTKVGPILSSTDLIEFKYETSLFTMANRPMWGTAG